jgi:hypothetical protein
MPTPTIAAALLDAGYQLHNSINPDGQPRLWADHTNGPNTSRVYVRGFGDFNQLVTADIAGRHETYTPATADGLIAAAQIAAAHVDGSEVAA